MFDIWTTISRGDNALGDLIHAAWLQPCRSNSQQPDALNYLPALACLPM